MRVPHPIPYQGSKRSIANFILAYVPGCMPRLVEPFAGSAAVSIAAAVKGKAACFLLNDTNQPLMALWHQIIDYPEQIARAYEDLWRRQSGREREFYDFVRDEFNKTQRPDYLLYLLARCVKASVRYNSHGAFNQGPDNRRKGRQPAAMAADIRDVSRLFRGRTELYSKDYREILRLVSQEDLVYMDPPYQGVCGNRDPRYSDSVEFEAFVGELEVLALRQISFMVSYDGRRGDQAYGKLLPENIGLHRLEIRVGTSAQSTLLGRRDTTYESLYLSKPLVDRLGLSTKDLAWDQQGRQMRFEFERV